MTDSSETFRRLIGPKYYPDLLEIIAGLDPPLPSIPEDLSQHDKTLVAQFGVFIVWLGRAEECKFTGDPIPPPPENPIVPLLAREMGLLDTPSDEQV